jgi:hypothetical protein
METSFSRLPPHWSIFFTWEKTCAHHRIASRQKEEDGGAARSAPLHHLTRLLLQVMFNSAFIAHSGLVRVLTGMSARSTLAQQIPALVQLYLQLLHALVLIACQFSFMRLLQQRVFLINQRCDLVQNVLIALMIHKDLYLLSA